MMKKAPRVLGWFLITIGTLGLFSPDFTGAANDGEVVRRARSAYYNLRELGFTGFAANLEPNWEVILKGAASAEALKLFRGLRFSVSLDDTGTVKVSRHGPAPPAITEDRIKEIDGNVARLVTGFFRTWKMFMMGSPFPEGSRDLQIENLGKQYRLSFAGQGEKVVTTMTDDFTITEVKVSAPTYNGTIKPRFEKTSRGYVLTSYEGNYEPTSGQRKTRISVRIDYEEVGGLKLPQKVRFSGTYSDDPIEAELLLNQYELKPLRH